MSDVTHEEKLRHLEDLHFEDHKKIFTAVDNYHRVIILEEKIKELEKDRASNAMWTRTFLPMLITSVISLFAWFTIEIGSINSELAAREVRIQKNLHMAEENGKYLDELFRKLEKDNMDIYDRFDILKDYCLDTFLSKEAYKAGDK